MTKLCTDKCKHTCTIDYGKANFLNGEILESIIIHLLQLTWISSRYVHVCKYVKYFVCLFMSIYSQTNHQICQECQDIARKGPWWQIHIFTNHQMTNLCIDEMVFLTKIGHAKIKQFTIYDLMYMYVFTRDFPLPFSSRLLAGSPYVQLDLLPISVSTSWSVEIPIFNIFFFIWK